MHNISVAVIDDCVNSGIFKEIDENKFDFYLADKKQLYKGRKPHGNETHGTVCAAIFEKYTNCNKIICIQVLDEISRSGSVDRLLLALRWCELHEIKICSLSLGVIGHFEQTALRKQIAGMIIKGHIIVAAMGNDNHSVIPADLLGVIRVRACDNLWGAQCAVGKRGLFEPDVLASGKHELMYTSGKETLICGENSFAVPAVTAMVYKLLMKNSHLDVFQILNGLYNDCILHNCGKNFCGYYRDIVWSRIEKDEYINNLHLIKTLNISVPILFISGESLKRIRIGKKFIHFMKKHSYYSIMTEIGSSPVEKESLWFPEHKLFYQAAEVFVQYYELDYLVVCLAKKDFQAEDYELSVPHMDSKTMENEFEKIKSLWEEE
ncbi:S8 family serine peptidase [Eisenbergiella porci]|uniref:S8 family serine peptidase n=1 Tax=Eisenbergiella porci TaxID=2652274 RepID=UPI002A8000BC|nr:S8 family serine peptidase [Eisenbergiella porci]